MELTIVEQSDGLSHVALVGRLDMEGVQSVQLKFLGATAAAGKNTIVDLSGLTFTASLGIAIMIDAAKALQRKGAKLVLASPTELVRNVLVNARIDQVIPIADSVEDAKKLLQTA